MFHEDLLDWQEAPAGKWFTGVTDIETGRVCIAPWDIQDTEGVATNAGDRNDSDGLIRFRRRNMNRYASDGGSDDMLRYRIFSSGLTRSIAERLTNCCVRSDSSPVQLRWFHLDQACAVGICTSEVRFQLDA